MTDQDTAQKPIGEGLFHGSPRQPYFIDETDTVNRFFPRPVNLTLPDHTQRRFPAGNQAIPRQLADDPWLTKNGVVDYEARPDKLPPMMRTAPVGSMGHAQAIMQGGVYDATLVPDARVSDDQIKFAEDMARAAIANVDVAQSNLERAVEVAKDAMARLEDAKGRRLARDRVDPQDGEDENDRLTPAQRKALAKDRAQNEARLGLDQLSEEDRAKFEALSNKDKAKYLGASAEDRAAMLAK